MKVKYIHITNLAYFFTDTLNWHVLWGKEKYLFKTNLNNKECIFQGQISKGQINFINSIKVKEPKEFRNY